MRLKLNAKYFYNTTELLKIFQRENNKMKIGIMNIIYTLNLCNNINV